MTSPRTTQEMPVSELIMRTATHARIYFLPFLCALTVLLSFYVASISTKPGWLTYGISTLAMAIIAVTALARVNDITIEQTSMRWNVRRIGLIMAGTAAVAIVCEPLIIFTKPGTALATMTDFPTWREVMLRWGIALTWITTPHMPPWANYITGKYRTLHDAKLAAVSPIVTGLVPDAPGDETPIYLQEELKEQIPRDGYDRRSGIDRRHPT